MTKYYHAPDLARSLRSGAPDPWLAPDLAQSIRAGRAKQWVDPDLAGDLVAASGGGVVPNWVPADAKIYIDLVNDRAWTEDDGEVAVDTLLGADANTENAWDVTGYNSADLTADGLVYSEHPPAFIGGSRTAFLDGCTFRAAFKKISGSNDTMHIIVASADGNDALQIDLSEGSGDVELSSYGAGAKSGILDVVNSGLGSINVVAATVTSTQLDAAVNGSTAVGNVLDATDVPPGNPFVAALMDFSFTIALQSITIYDALPSTVGLSALSETGVTNTAPTAISLVWQFPVTEVDATHATVSTLLPGGNQLFNSLQAVDAEGNPPTWALTDDDGGKFQYQGFVNSVSAVDSLGPGTYHFTLRATDPGGLYVEQEFTITVTA